MRMFTILLVMASLTQASVLRASPSKSDVARRNLAVMTKFYPKESLKRGEEGTVKFSFLVNNRGGIDGCQVTQSSGYLDLDKATCEMMLAGATAVPKRESKGRRLRTMETGAMKWILPKTALRPSSPPPFTTEQNVAGEGLTCLRHRRTGTLTVEDKVCLNRKDWQELAQRTSETMLIMQGFMGSGGGGEGDSSAKATANGGG